ncbi:hypothetical protein HNR23_001086 [Nocardiopsis mwathae]|uniref:D-alanyl-D-alanine carboxypeptidase-like core domain-containing protein n=1 Tax=Nocardiopsis mwathae TaxID=1472723 RepID=A0A7W9YGU6_9ACTN|nr:hypothetical protein [Nocardiopsis mwathae]
MSGPTALADPVGDAATGQSRSGPALAAAADGPASAAGTDAADTVGGLKAELAAVRSRLDDLYDDADRAILRYLDEARRMDEAERAVRSARRAAERAAQRHEDSRADAVRHASAAYKGADLHPAAAWSEPGGPQEVLDRAAYLKVLSERRGHVLDRANAGGVAADTLRSMADSAVEKQQEATEAAAEAKREAFDAVRAQEEAVSGVLARQSELEARLSRAAGGASGAEQRRTGALARAEQAARNGSGDPASSGSGEGAAAAPATRPQSAGSPDGGSDRLCTGGDLGQYANGRIPRSALCPLPQPGEMLRADAAAAFIELDRAFAKRFGRAMCVTDSYRPLDEQVRLFREMAAGMAARPGTSTHGLGIAVDLCGGVNEHGSAEHGWMLANAPRYGWHNPPWARNGFEPWHWEFSAP